MISFARISLAAAALTAALSAGAEKIIGCLSCPRPPQSAFEYFNVHSGHYFYTLTGPEMEAVENGRAGPGWVRTGLYFGVYIHPDWSLPPLGGISCASGSDPCRPVYRFYSAKSNSHFFTVDAAEATSLQGPGSEWKLEGIPFYVPAPNAAGQCNSSLRPIYRFYNNRWQVNDSNHRFAANGFARRLMPDRGWTTEGIAFCAYGASSTETLNWIFMPAGRENMRRSDECLSATFAPDSCIALRNLPLPSIEYAGVQQPDALLSDPFGRRLGIYLQNAVNVGYAAPSRESAAEATFLQFYPRTPNLFMVGIHLNAEGAQGGSYSEISPYQRVRLPTTAGSDRRFFPWRIEHNTEFGLRISYQLGVMRFNAAPDGAAYGALSMEFLDSKSGQRLQFNVLAYARESGDGGEYIARDVKSGMALVGIGSGFPSRFAETAGAIITQGGSAQPGYAAQRSFTVQMQRDQFREVIEAARTVDAALSPDPDDYVFERFGVVNETYGQGRLAVFVGPLSATRIVAD